MIRKQGRIGGGKSCSLLAARCSLLAALVLLATAATANMLTEAPSQWARGPAGLVHYKDLGHGSEAIVFIHGWACDMAYFGEQVPHFAGRMHVIAIDLPGHGESEKPEANYTQALFAEAVKNVLDAAKVKRAVLVGHSMGMSVARNFYRAYPKRTLGIVSLDGSVQAMITDQSTIDMIMANLRGPDYLKTATMMVDSMLAKAPDSPYKGHVRDVLLETPQHVVASSAAGMFDLSLWNDDPIKVPVLLLHANLPIWTPEYEAYAHKIIPNLDYRKIDGVSHFLHTEKPEEVNKAIDEFLAKNALLGQK